MQNAKTILTLGLAAFALAACGSNEQQNTDQNMAANEALPNGQLPENADIEMLPADESSTTPSGELQNGFVAPEANETGTAENAQ